MMARTVDTIPPGRRWGRRAARTQASRSSGDREAARDAATLVVVPSHEDPGRRPVMRDAESLRATRRSAVSVVGSRKPKENRGPSTRSRHRARGRRWEGASRWALRANRPDSRRGHRRSRSVLDADLLGRADPADHDVHRLLADAAPALLAQQERPGDERDRDEDERAARHGLGGEEPRERVALSAAEGTHDEERARERRAGGSREEENLRQDSPR